MVKKSLIDELFYASPVYADLMNKLKVAVYIYDEKGRTVFMNKAAETMEGLKLEDVKGLLISDIYSQDYSPSLKALETGKIVEDLNNVYMVRGRKYHQVTRAYPIEHEGKVIGIFTTEEDVTPLEKILDENIRLQKRNQKICEDPINFSMLIGKDSRFLNCIEIARTAAENDATVLLSGPTGSGKEMFAKSIHNSGKRKKGPYLAINCAAIPETLLESILFGTVKGSFTGAEDKPGLFEQAKGGTLFLDEINSMPMDAQAKLLRVLEERECRRVGGNKDIKIDVRVISSINDTPQKVLERKELRTDLFYRLAVINVIIPPLYKRAEDIMLLTDYFIKKYNRKLGCKVEKLDQDVEIFFRTYQWPGNVRQLKHAVESGLSMAGTSEVLRLNMLPPYLFEERTSVDHMVNPEIISDRSGNGNLPEKPAADLSGNVADIYEEKQDIKQPSISSIKNDIRRKERDMIVQTLYECNGNVSKAARTLNMNRQSLIYKMKKYEIK